MNASKTLVRLIREKRDKDPELSHEEAYKMVSDENPGAVEDFLIEIGVKEPGKN